MESRVKKLQRLAALYQVVEHANGVSMDQARVALHGVESGIAARALDASRLEVTSHEALAQGDLPEWQLDQSQLGYTQWNAASFEELRQSRAVMLQRAAEIYQASRMQLEQMQSVVDEVRLQAARERLHAEQRISDDRYLARQRWLQRVAERRRANRERKSLLQASGGDKSE